MRGTAAHNPGRLNPAEPTLSVTASDAKPPAWLNLSPLAKRAWRDLRTLVGDRMRVATDADLIALGLLADALASYVEAKRIAGAEGATYETVNETGARMLRAHPIVAMGAESARFAKLLLSEFGLTPAARAKVSSVGGAAKDPVEQWLNEGTGS